MHYKRTGQKGVSMAIVLMVVMIVTIIGMAASTVGVRSLQVMNKNKYNAQAQYSAEAGLAKAIMRIKNDWSWQGYDNPGDADGLTFLNEPMPSAVDSTFSVRVYNNFNGSSSIEGENGILVPPKHTFIVSEGKVGSPDLPKAERKVGIMLGRAGLFNFGLFGKESVDLRGNVNADTYDSRLGPYGPGTMVSGECDIGTNGTQDGAFNINGSAGNYDGTLYGGAGSDVNAVFSVSGHPTVTGGYDVLPTPKDLPGVEIPAGMGPPQPIPVSWADDEVRLAFEPDYRYHHANMTSRSKAPGGSKKTADPVTIPPGSYEAITAGSKENYVLHGNGGEPGIYVFQGIDLRGGAVLEIDNSQGPVIIYCDGPIDLRGRTGIDSNLHHKTGSFDPKPTDVRIYGTPNCTKVDFRGNPDAFMCLYAPDADIEVHGNAEVYGAMVGNTISFRGNPPFHYDIALRELDDIPVMNVGSFIRF